MKHKLIYLFICILGTLTLGFIAGFATADGVNNWYLTIKKPSFNPPNYLFGPVWTCLYILLGISLYLIIVKKTTLSKTQAYCLFVIQMLLNVLWSFIFFSMNNIFLAFVEIVVLWMFILWMIFSFYKIDKTSALINIPYLLWVGFASFLNGTIYFLNR